MFLSKKGATQLVLMVCGAWLLGGAAVAVVAVLYAPLPDGAAAVAGLVLGTAAARFLTGRPDLSRRFTLRKRAGRWVPSVDWDLVLLVFGVVTVWVAALVGAVVAESV